MNVKHYEGEVETIEFIEEVITLMRLKPREAYALGNALKYARRAGRKGDWREDAYKCADYLARFRDGDWLED